MCVKSGGRFVGAGQNNGCVYHLSEWLGKIYHHGTFMTIQQVRWCDLEVKRKVDGRARG